MKIIAHRGAGKLAPENSLLAIAKSRDLGVSSIEIDIRPTKDKKLVVFHDKSLYRLARIDKRVSNLTLAELKKVKLKNGTYIPTLEEVIKEAGKTPLTIEGKDAGWATLLSRELKGYKNMDKLSVISFNPDELALFKSRMPNVHVFLLGFSGWKQLRLAKRYGFDGIDVFMTALHPFVHMSAKRNHKKMIIFTFNSRSLAHFFSMLYPDIAITTNRPDKLVGLIKPNEK